MRSLRLALLILLPGLLLAGCASTSSATLAEVTPQIVYVTTTPAIAPVAATPTLVPGFTPAPTPSGPYFSHEIVFAVQPDPALASRTFSRKMPQVYAMWRYSGMKAGLRVRRDWYQNGELYLERESDWDLAKYGASGVMFDTSIFDFANGLPSGHYELKLYIANQPQFSDEDAPFRSFDLGILSTRKSLSPDSHYNVVLDGGKALVIMDGAGRRREIARADGIAGFDWLPDSIHLAYATLTNGVSSLQDSYALWIADVETGDIIALSREGENLHEPLVSPDGGRIAVVTGSGAGDACSAGLSLAVIGIDRATLERTKLVTLADFAGWPAAGNGEPYPVASPDVPLPGVWISPAQLQVALRWKCANDPPNGVYMLNVVALSAEKVAPLPKP